MDRRKAFVSCLMVFIFRSAWSSELPPPQGVEVKSSILKWNSPPDKSNLNYTVQFSTVPEQEWHYVCGCNQTQFSFTAASEDFYGKIFRVRTETSNQSSAWVQSEQVQCDHTDTCAPLFNLTVKTDKVYMWIDYKDQSLKRTLGHINFKALYWKEDRVSDKQERKVGAGPLRIEGLESGQNYCFQVVYLIYDRKPYGRPSRVECKVIPLSSAEENIQIIVGGMLIVVVLFGIGVCLYGLYKNYKKVKLFLQPPLDIPEHIQQFFSEELPHQQLVCNGPSTQELELDNIVTFVSEDIRTEDGDRSDAT